MALTHKELVEVLTHLEESSCEEFSLQMEGVDLLLRRKVEGSERQPAPRPSLRQPAASPKQQAPQEQQVQEQRKAEPAAAAPTAQPGNGLEVVAPMSGTFYRRPAPDAPPFAEVGAQVKQGDPLCMIEVMKLFSTVYADYNGRVVSVEVDDSQTVEQGQALFVIEKQA
jgi:acetyl-CoA carboxylase biotin carboxyl carrier protein